MINCELFSHVDIATSPTPAVAHMLTHLAKLASGSKLGFKNEGRVRTCDFGLGPGSGLKIMPA